MIHAKAVKPRIFPWNRNVTPAQIDRVQDLGGDFTANIEKLYEIGRDGKLGSKQGTPSFAYSMTQFEYGSMDFWRQIANMEDPASDSLDNSVDLDDLKTTKFDITAYLTDDDTTFRGTIWFPKLRTSGFSINVGDPDATAMRSFDLIGEDYKILDEEYFSFEQATALADAPLEVTLDPVPILWTATDYIFRVLRVRSDVVTELTEDAAAGANTWKYDNVTKKVTTQTCLIDDIVKVYYPSSTAYATLWTDNDSDSDALEANSVKVELQVGVGASARIYRIQSVNIDVAFDRADYKELGNREVVQTGVKSKTTTITLGRLLEDFTIEQILRGTSAYPYIDARDLSEEVTLRAYIYEDYTLSTFKIGYKVTNLFTNALATAQAIEDYGTQNNTLESDNLMISDDETEIDA